MVVRVAEERRRRRRWRDIFLFYFNWKGGSGVLSFVKAEMGAAEEEEEEDLNPEMEGRGAERSA